MATRNGTGMVSPPPPAGLAGCGKTRFIHKMQVKSSIWHRCHNNHRMLKKASVFTRPAPVRRDAPFHRQGRRRGGTYRASLDPLASITCERIGFLPPLVPYVEPLSDARTKLADFFSILLNPVSDRLCFGYVMGQGADCSTSEHHTTTSSFLRS